MLRLAMRALNGPAIVLIAMLGLALQSTFFSFWIFPYVRPDTVLLLTVWLAMRRGFTEGGIITLIIGEISEIHSASPSGMFLISLMTCYLFVRLAAKLFVLPDLNSLLVVVALSTLLEKACVLAVLYLLGTPFHQFHTELYWLPPVAAINAAWAKWLYRWLEKFDLRTHKDIRADRSLEGDLDFEPGRI